MQVKQSRLNLNSIYISSDIADILSRLKLGKTLFKNQLHHIGLTDTPFCGTCLKELGLEITENLTHSIYECPFVATIISEIISTFFPNMRGHFLLREIILATTTDKHFLYEGKYGQQVASIIWDIFLQYIMKCRSNAKTPVAAICIHEIRSQLNKVLKILPNSQVSKQIEAQPQLRALLTINS